MKIARLESSGQREHAEPVIIIKANLPDINNFDPTGRKGFEEEVSLTNLNLTSINSGGSKNAVNNHATTKATTTKMTDEHNRTNLSNNINNRSAESLHEKTQIKSTTNEHIIVEATKKLLNHSANAEVGAYSVVSTIAQRPIASNSTNSNCLSFNHNNQHQQQQSENLSPASNRCITRNGVKTTNIQAIIQTDPSTVSTTQPKVIQLANITNATTLSKKDTLLKNTDDTMATAAALGSSRSTQLVADVKGTDIDIIDYTMSVTSPLLLNENKRGDSIKVMNSSKAETLSGQSNGDSDNFEFERNLSSVCSGKNGSNFGGRLQFFKNGKVILELKRSKEGEKGRWISVPRKMFRSPSATSSTVTPTLATSIAYAKNESSTSFSFSDDNSSIQSSPWQREHCWKQQSPRPGISKAMSLYYQRPRSIILTRSALKIARKKRRRPYDTTLLLRGMFSFENKERLEVQTSDLESSRLHVMGNVNDGMEKETDELSKNRNGNIRPELNYEDDRCSSSSTATLTGNDSTDVRMGEGTPTPLLNSTPNSTCKDKKPNKTKETSEITELGSPEKMNTSEESSSTTLIDHEESESKMNGELNDTLSLKTVKSCIKDAAVREKPLCGESKSTDCNQKTRLKLNAIIQKLIDRVPIRLEKLTNKTHGDVNSLLHKASPPNSSTATRLVEVPQQHVSPRKRILREFEKVSLEDNLNVSGGKRSRAKSNASSSASLHHSNKSPKSQSGFNAPNSSGNSVHRSSLTSFSKSETTTQSLTTPAPTRLYSSYSIHSLLGGNGSCNNTISSISNANVCPNKKSSETAIVSSVSYHQQHYPRSPQQHLNDPSYLRAMLASPKSPDNQSGCRKSPSIAATKKRSPPYASPLREGACVSELGTVNNKSSYVLDQGGNHDSNSPMYSNSHSQSYSQTQKQGLYLPYMSTKYVPSGGCSAVTSSSSFSPNSYSSVEPRSPHHVSAFSRTSSPISVSTNIPLNHSGSCSTSNCRESSPPPTRASTERDSTPRTVPKKTASIRRQFASPTALAGSSGSLSPNELQRRSPSGNTVPSSLQHYYLYPPAPSNGTSSPVPQGSTVSPNSAMSIVAGNTTSAAAAAAAAATAAASYIPSVMSPAYMNPYFALAALRHTPQIWSHYNAASLPLHLSSSGPSASARLSPPSFHNFAYNGVNAAMVAVMQQQQQQQQILASSALLHRHSLGSPPALPTSLPSRNVSRDRQHSPTTMTDRATDLAANTAGSNTIGLDIADNSIATEAAKSSFYRVSNKEDQSSDVPLNLSKH